MLIICIGIQKNIMNYLMIVNDRIIRHATCDILGLLSSLKIKNFYR